MALYCGKDLSEHIPQLKAIQARLGFVVSELTMPAEVIDPMGIETCRGNVILRGKTIYGSEITYKTPYRYAHLEFPELFREIK